jgi:acetolactate synthase I/II/III large subunit
MEQRMPRLTGGQAVVETLAGAGVTRVFGVPGESFMGVLDALQDGPVSFVSARQEGGGAFMASGWAALSGEVAVCMGTRAVGSANMAIGIHNAQQDSLPMVAIAGQVNRDFLGREAFQEVDLVGVFSHLCKWAVQIDDARRVPELLSQALYVAQSGRPGAVFVSLPQDVSEEVADMELVTRRLPVAPHPDPAALDAALDALAGAERPLIYAGHGLTSPAASELLVRLAEALEVPVVMSWRRHDGFPNDHRLYLGTAGVGAPPTVWERVRACDIMLALGTRFQENATADYTLPAVHTRLLQVDLEPRSMSGHAVPDLAIQADAAATVAALLELAGRPAGSERRRARNDADRAAFVEATTLPAPRDDEGTVDHQTVVGALGDALGPDGVVCSDAGNFYGWLSRYYRFRRPRTYLGPASGAMGYGLPAAIGAQLARPDRPVVCVAGDGGFAMTIQELETARRYGVGVTVLVLDNRRHGTIRMHQERAHPGRPVGTELGSLDVARIAEGFGAHGHRVQANHELASALKSALAESGPSVLHVLMDRDQLSVDQRLDGEAR